MAYDTIAAVATPKGVGGIAVIRISGENAIVVCEKIFKSKKPLSEYKSHTVHFGDILYDNKIIDKGVAAIFLAPNSYTGEDTVEISCHGGLKITDLVLKSVISSGARLANAGEFTKRAFLNGKMNLLEAEAVAELINSDTNNYLQASLSQLDGFTGKKITELKNRLTDLLSQFFAVIDYPDEDIEDLKKENMLSVIGTVKNELTILAKSFDQGKIIKNGLVTVIVGKPNTGKSMLMNALSKTDKSIVTDIAGTTRDIIEESVLLGDTKLLLIDTAGIHDTDDTIEKIGVNRSFKAVDRADLVLFIIDSSVRIDNEDIVLAKHLKEKNKKFIILINKSDISSLKDSDIKKLFIALDVENSEYIIISAKFGSGLDDLEKLISKKIGLSEINSANTAIILNERHFNCLTGAISALENCYKNFAAGVSADILVEDISEAIKALGEITGSEVTEEIVKSIFANFCVGK